MYKKIDTKEVIEEILTKYKSPQRLDLIASGKEGQDKITIAQRFQNAERLGIRLNYYLTYASSFGKSWERG